LTRLVESHSNTFLASPGDITRAHDSLVLDLEFELAGNAHGADDFEASASLGNVSDSAINAAHSIIE
jgi:hypothetical protein